MSFSAGLEALVGGIIVMLFGSLMYSVGGYGVLGSLYMGLIYLGLVIFIFGPVWYWIRPLVRRAVSQT